MYRDMTRGGITRSLLLFALPMMAGSLLQQLYNVADTLIVGRALGRDAMAAVGSAFTLMTFLTSVFLGLAMGAGALFSIYLGRKDMASLHRAAALALCLIGGVTAAVTALVYVLLDPILRFLQVPDSLYLLRSAGNSAAPLWFLGGAALLNVGLDLLFVLVLRWGVSGAAAATVIAQYAAGLGLTIYALLRCRHILPRRADFRFDRHILRELMDLSLLTCAQQSAMNFGILLIQRLVDSFGPVVMAAFAAAVKIDAFAYLPVQEFGNAFSTFSAQNYGAGQSDRLRQGLRQATAVSAAFSCAAAALVVVFARPLMGLFVQAGDTAVIACGVRYLRIEGTFYAGIGCLFLLYGFYRAVQRPGMSVVLTVVSLGTRVALAYALAGPVGEVGIWAAIPIGWFLADAAGYSYYLRHRKALLTPRAQ